MWAASSGTVCFFFGGREGVLPWLNALAASSAHSPLAASRNAQVKFSVFGFSANKGKNNNSKDKR